MLDVRYQISEIRIVPQVFRVGQGPRMITYALFINGVFACYSRCFCGAMRIAEYLRNV